MDLAPLLSTTLLLALGACSSDHAGPAREGDNSRDLRRTAEPAIAEPAIAQLPATDAHFDPATWAGRCVEAEGLAQAGKIGPRLNLGRGTLGVIFPDDGDWSVPLGVRVRVRGRIAERSDLPVFIARPDEPAIQGIAVPPGTDLDQARRRWVIEDAEASVVRTLAQVELDLEARLGESVELSGILWSLNGHWWFDHDGVELHLEGPTSLTTGGHAEATTLTGVLTRKPMPRIDQIVRRPDRELSDAFVLKVEARGPAPALALRECPA